MASMTLGRTTVEAPEFVPLTGGIFSAADVIPAGARTEMMGVQYEAEAAHTTHAIALDSATCLSTAAKDFDGFDWEEGDPFHVYAGVGCTAFNTDDFEAKATRRLEMNEQRGVEQHLWENVFPERAVDLTPAGGAVKPKIALGILEEYAGSNYSGVPLIHFGRRLGQFLAGETLLKFGDRGDATSGGGLAVNGAGYVSLVGPDSEVAADGEVWAYITGHIVLRQGIVFTQEAIDPQTNRMIALAERTYVATVDSLVGAIRVTLE